MTVRSVKTDKILPGRQTIFEILDKYLPDLKDGSIIAITSKIIALCENRVAPVEGTDKENLALQEASYYLPPDHSKYHHHFTIAHDTLVGMSGIDESNAGGYYVLLPKDPQASANQIRKYLRDKYGLKKLGVIITDSVSIPLRLGAVGAYIAYSGFLPVKDYRGKPDLFGRPFKISQANVATGLASAAALAMGEGSEQTPIAVIENIRFIQFCENDPSAEELKSVNLSLENDLFAPFLKNAPWQKGGKK